MQVAREQAQQQRNSTAAARREQGRQLAEAREEVAALSAELFQLQETLRLRDSTLRRLKRRLDGAGLPGSVRLSEVCSPALHVKQQPAGSPGTVRHSSSCLHTPSSMLLAHPTMRAGCCSDRRCGWPHEARLPCAAWPFAGSAGCCNRWPSWQGQAVSGELGRLLSALQTACCSGKMVLLPGQGLGDKEHKCTAWGGARPGGLPDGVIALHRKSCKVRCTASRRPCMLLAVQTAEARQLRLCLRLTRYVNWIAASFGGEPGCLPWQWQGLCCC